MTDFKNKRAEVLGFGKSNRPLVRWLLNEGAFVTVRDIKTLEGDGLKEEYEKDGVRFICGENYLDGVDGDYIFRTPGIKFDVPEIQNAIKKGAVLTSEMEIFFERCPGKIIGITGSDGKTTTTTIIYGCLKRYYGEDRVFVGGNIGSPLLPLLDKMTKDSFSVVELSSFQLQTMKKSPDYSIITNLAPNHLNYHKDFEEYIASKCNIFLHQHGGRTVLNSKNEHTRALMDKVPKDTELKTFVASGTENIDGVIYRDGEKYLETKDILIPGNHNIENYEGVIALIGDLVPKEIIVDFAKTFKGVEHRIELVRNKDGIRYYNSSIDSSPSRTDATLRAFPEGTGFVVICGGRDKHLPLEPLADVLCEKARDVVLMGEAMEIINEALDKKTGKKPNIYLIRDFYEACKKAFSLAKAGDVVVLSPSCTSFDAFENFEERGEAFKKLVNEL